jgi:hybrid cluster-associated redox disulfide protein
MQKITKDMKIGELLRIDGGFAPILLEIGMHCLGCPSSQNETIEEACQVHSTSADGLVDKLNAHLTTLSA